MTAKILNLSERMPHVIVQTKMRIYVYPVSYFRRWLAGAPGVEPPPPEVIRAIVRTWLLTGEDASLV